MFPCEFTQYVLARVQMHVYFVHRQVNTSDRSRVNWVHPGECICQFDTTAMNVLDAHVVLLYAE